MPVQTHRNTTVSQPCERYKEYYTYIRFYCRPLCVAIAYPNESRLLPNVSYVCYVYTEKLIESLESLCFSAKLKVNYDITCSRWKRKMHKNDLIAIFEKWFSYEKLFYSNLENTWRISNEFLTIAYEKKIHSGKHEAGIILSSSFFSKDVFNWKAAVAATNKCHSYSFCAWLQRPNKSNGPLLCELLNGTRNRELHDPIRFHQEYMYIQKRNEIILHNLY